MAGSGQCDGRHANGRGFPGLAPPRCHPGPPSLSLSESSSPARECAQGRGARGEVARPARAAIPPPPVLLLPPRLPGRGLPKGRGGGGVRRGCRGHRGRTESSTQRPSEHPAGRSCGQRRRWWPAPPPHAGNRRGDRVRSLGSGEAGRRGSSPAPPPASPRPAKPPPRRPHTSL